MMNVCYLRAMRQSIYSCLWNVYHFYYNKGTIAGRAALDAVELDGWRTVLRADECKD